MFNMSEKIFKGGSFLVEDLTGDDVITPEDFTEEHKMIAKTTEDFVEGEVIPLVDKLENHEFEHSVELLKKAGELGLLSADIPEEYGGLNLDRIRDRKSTRLNSSHVAISYAVFCLKK